MTIYTPTGREIEERETRAAIAEGTEPAEEAVAKAEQDDSTEVFRDCGSYI